MRNPAMTVGVGLAIGLVLAQACAYIPNREHSQPAGPTSPRAAEEFLRKLAEKGTSTKPEPVLRYELRDVKAGPLATSALVDRENGRVWLLSLGTDRKFHFVEVEVQGRATNSRDPLGILETQPKTQAPKVPPKNPYR